MPELDPVITMRILRSEGEGESEGESESESEGEGEGERVKRGGKMSVDLA